jgi:hypothetical protein
MIAVAWMAGSHFDHPVRTVVQQESAQGAEMSRAAQNFSRREQGENPVLQHHQHFVRRL